jgi:GDP-4-dehydro-6-deoxy-D-mannose reductase
MKVLILGITGFAGTTTYKMLREMGSIDINGTYRHSTSNTSRIALYEKASLYECDINNVLSIESVLEEVRPDIIFYFCAYVSVFSSIKNPSSTYQTNVLGAINLLESVKKISPDSKVLIPGSAEQYGFVTEKKMPIKESYSLNPQNPYAMTKKNQEEIGLFYFRQFGLNLYFTRTFHCTGPYQSAGFVCSDIARQVVAIEEGKASLIKIGNLEAKRDFLDMRDITDAYWKILIKGKPGEIYNVCRGESLKIQSILDKLIDFSGKDIAIQVDPAKLRKSDVPDFIGDNQKLIEIGWTPKYKMDQTLLDLLNSLRQNG